jgi:hypothetical protein
MSHVPFLRVPLLPKAARSPGFHPSMSFLVGFFVCLLPRSCSFRPRSLMPFSHSESFQLLFSSVRLFGISCSTMSLVGYFLTKSLLRRATPARRVTFIQAAVTSFRSPQFLCVQDFLKMFLLCHATVARRLTCHNMFVSHTFQSFCVDDWLVPHFCISRISSHLSQ